MASRGRFRQRLLANRYVLLSEVGTGGMGTVYRARDRVQDRYVAIKLLHPHLRRDPAFVERFRREADLAMRLDSRHIVQVIGSGRDGNDQYLVMELVEGADLTDIIQGRGALPQATAASYAVQVCRALEEAHGKGVVHRDIKPRNILVQPDGTVKVADFGIARAQDAETSRSTDEMGAAAYMDPARLNPNRYGAMLDGRTDIYSLGVVIYEMLSGRPPFSGDTYELLNQILHTQPPDLAALRPDLDPELLAITQACLAKDPAQRPATAGEVRQAIAHLAEEPGEVPRQRGLVRVLLAPASALLSPFWRHGRPSTALKAIVTGTVATAFLAASLAFGVLVVLPVAEDDGEEPSVIAPTIVPPTPRPTVVVPPAGCFQGGSVSISAALTQCPAATLAFTDNCPRGMICGVQNEDPVAPLLLSNDRTVALIDPSGNVAIAREDGSEQRRLTNHGQAQQPAWSPDGRYIAYVQHSPIRTPEGQQLPATQLRVVDVDNPAEDRVVLASNAADPAVEVRRLIEAPQWSGDGKKVQFLWPPEGDAGDTIYAVDLPTQNNLIDLAALPKEPPQPAYFVATKQSRLNLTAADFGQPNGHIGEFTIRPNGNVIAVFCDTKRGNRCGLGEWDGLRSRVIMPLSDAGILLSGPGSVTDTSILASILTISRDDRLSQIDLATGVETRLRKIDRDGLMVSSLSSSPFAASSDGKSALVQTAAAPVARLSLMPLTEGQPGKPWSDGGWPSWYMAGRPPTSSSLPSSPVNPPPTPMVSPTPPPASTVRPMAVNVTVRRQNAFVSGAQVVSLVEGQECASGTTGDNGYLRLTTPAQGRPAVCSQTGAIVTFRVNGNPVDNRVVFSPNATASAEIILP